MQGRTNYLKPRAGPALPGCMFRLDDRPKYGGACGMSTALGGHDLELRRCRTNGCAGSIDSNAACSIFHRGILCPTWPRRAVAMPHGAMAHGDRETEGQQSPFGSIPG